MNKRQRRIAGAILILMPSIGLMSLISSPRWEMLRAVDVVQLLGSGACVGAGLILLLAKPFKD
jgi:hypothetical protein